MRGGEVLLALRKRQQLENSIERALEAESISLTRTCLTKTLSSEQCFRAIP